MIRFALIHCIEYLAGGAGASKSHHHMPAKSKTVVIRFALTKGEGEPPQSGLVSRKEKLSPETMCTFFLDGAGEGEELTGMGLRTVRFLDNGITHSGGDDPVFNEDGLLVGAPCPIVEFHFAKEVNVEKVRKTVWGSSYHIKPKKQNSPFYCEDWNGYTSALFGRDLELWKDRWKTLGVMPSKKFFPSQIAAGINAAEMTGFPVKKTGTTKKQKERQ